MASGSGDTTVKIWDIESGSCYEEPAAPAAPGKKKDKEESESESESEEEESGSGSESESEEGSDEGSDEV